MTFSRIAQVSLLMFVATLAVTPFIPRLVSADWQNCNNQYWSNNCTPGILHVYVLALRNEQNSQVRQPSDFAVVVNGQNTSTNSFPGSQSGTTLSVNGAYAVTAAAVSGYEPTYSVGCNSSVMNNQESTCVITEHPTYAYNTVPQPYQYTNAPQNLSCVSLYQTVGLGQTATFTAVGGGGSTFNWTIPTRTYPAVGPVLNVMFPNTGTQMVVVSNGYQTATCTILVVVNGNSILAPLGSNVYPAPATTLVTKYIPSLPNTGFAPLSRQQLTFALLALIAAGFFLAPYVRKAITIARG